jgi:excisionase family DNA binding protein
VNRTVSTSEVGGKGSTGGGLLTPEEAAGRLRIGRTFIYLLLREGVIPSVKIGRVRRVRVRDVDKYVESLLSEQSR